MQGLIFRGRVLLLIELVILAFSIGLPVFADSFWIIFSTRVLVLGLLALSFDLAWGYAGILSFGQALFFGVSGYCVALSATKLGITSAVALLSIAIGAGLLTSLLMAGVILFGKYTPTQVFVALGSLTGSYVVDRAVRGWEFVGGQNGIPSIPSASLWGGELEEGVFFYYVALGILCLVYLGLRLLVRSQLGLVLAALRQSEERVGFLGYPSQNLKGLVFCLAGMVAGLSGGLYVLHEGFVGPGQVGPAFSTQAVLYVMFGGAGTLVGALIGTALIEIVSFFGSQYWDVGWPILLGVLLLLVVTWRPSGVVGMMVPMRERIGSFGHRRRKEKV